MTRPAAFSARQSASRIFKNARTLVSAKAVGGVLSLAYLAIAARSLGPEQLGVLILVHAYAVVVAGIAGFQSWQAIIRFGAPMQQGDDRQALKSLIRFAIRIDIISAAVAFLIAVVGAPYAARFMGWSDDVVRLVYVYSLVIPFLIAATPTGLLRLFDDFKILSLQQIVMPAIRFVGAVGLWAAGADVNAFILLWILSALMSGASLWFFGLRALHKRDLTPNVFGKTAVKASPEWLPFMVKTNLSSSIEMSHTELPVLIVGAVLGPVAAGFLRIATNLSNLIAHPANMLNWAIFPELSKVETTSGRGAMLRVVARSVVTAVGVAAPIVILFAIFRRDLAVIVGGEAFLPAAPIIALMAAAQLFRLVGIGLDSAVLARGRPGWALGGQAAAALTHLLLLYGLMSVIGVVAAPIAFMAGWLALIVVLVVASLT